HRRLLEQADADPLIRPRSMFIDSHCHLSFPELKQRLPDILAEMRAAQVVQAICICTQMEEFEAVHALALEHPQLWSTVGVHPDT
ncbi:TatD family hydrolase, partial [Klebsiella pneumoniae]